MATRVIAIDAIKFAKKGANRFRGEITVDYSVNDIYHRTSYSLPTIHLTEESARAELSRFPPGSQVRVFYNPTNPYDILLDLSASPRFFLFPGLLTALGMLLGGYAVWLLSKLGTCLCPGCAASVEMWDKFCYACDYKLPRQKKLVRL